MITGTMGWLTLQDWRHLRCRTEDNSGAGLYTHPLTAVCPPVAIIRQQPVDIMGGGIVDILVRSIFVNINSTATAKLKPKSIYFLNTDLCSSSVKSSKLDVFRHLDLEYYFRGWPFDLCRQEDLRKQKCYTIKKYILLFRNVALSLLVVIPPFPIFDVRNMTENFSIKYSVTYITTMTFDLVILCIVKSKENYDID